MITKQFISMKQIMSKTISSIVKIIVVSLLFGIYGIQYLKMILTRIINAIFLYSLIDIVQAQTISLPSNIEANVRLLYSNTNAALTNQTFTITFTFSNFNSIPSFGFGIKDFQMGNSLSNQNFISLSTSLTSKSVGIQIKRDITSIVYKFSISYISVWENTNIFVISKDYVTNLNTINNGTGSRTFKIVHEYSFATTSTSIIPFLRGFQATTNGGTFIQIKIAAYLFSLNNYIIQITTTANCVIQMIGYDYLFYYNDILTASNYYFAGDTTTFSSSTTFTSTYTRTLSYYDKTVFIIALAGVNTYVANTPTFGWTILDQTDNIATIQITKQYVQATDYSYFQIGSKSKSSSESSSPSKASTSESTSYIGIIAGLIVGVTVISGIAVAVFKVYMAKPVYSTPNKDDFRILPALSF